MSMSMMQGFGNTTQRPPGMQGGMGGMSRLPQLSKSPKGYKSVSTFDPRQSQLWQQLLGSMSGQNANIQQNELYQSGEDYLQNLLGGGDQAFADFEAPYMRQFNEQTVPGLAERFSGLGSGAQSSSAFQQALGQAGSGLSENLAQLRSMLQMNALPQALGYSQQPFDNLRSLFDVNTQAYMQKKPSFWQQLLMGGVQGLGQGLGGAARGGF